MLMPDNGVRPMVEDQVCQNWVAWECSQKRVVNSYIKLNTGA